MAAAEHEPVATEPGRVGRVVTQQPLEQQVCRRGEAHCRPGMTTARGLDRIHGKSADHVDGE
jgi:hypothetical protein